jgi:hypothetical protein
VTSLKDDQNKGRLKLFSPLRAAAASAAAWQSAGTPFFISLWVSSLQLHARINNDNKTPTIKEEVLVRRDKTQPPAFLGLCSKTPPGSTKEDHLAQDRPQRCASERSMGPKNGSRL